MASPRSTRKIQIGPESGAGTLTAATSVWRGPGALLKDERKIERIPEDIGLLAPTNRSLTYFLQGSLAMPSQVATLEKIAYLMSASIKNTMSGAADGAGTDKIYAYAEPVSTTKNTIKTYTVEAGDSQQAEVGEFGFVEEWELSGAKDGAVMLSAKWRVRQVVKQAFTAALAVTAQHEVTFNNSKLWLDAAGGTIGSTQKTKTFSRFSLKKSGGWKPIPTGGDGNLYYADIDYTDPKYTLDITFLHDATSVAAKDAMRAETGQLIRMEFYGAANATPGTTYTKNTLRIDLAGKWLDFDVVGEQDGFEIVTGKFEAMLDTTASLFASVTCAIDGLASLT